MQRNITNNLCKTKKNSYYRHQLNINKYDDQNLDNIENGNYINDKIMWKNFKTITNNNKQVPPRNINHNGKFITSIKDICDIANQFYIDKIKKIRDNFTINNKINPINILSSLIKRNPNQIYIKYATNEQILKIISKAKNKNSVGPDIVSMKVVKKLSPFIVPHITHLVNAIIRTEVYPSNLKLSWISPLLKPDKASELIESYRPINNLSVIDKIVEQYLKDQINDFLDINDILNENHHGSKVDYSTLTALSCIKHKLISNYHKGKISTLIQTNLSAMFDTIDHSILIQKLDHYGIRGKFFRIITSFLSNRTQYVSIDSIQSKILPALDCSCIQGSKLSALLYTLYINEVPLLSKLIDSDIYKKLTNDNSEYISNIKEHITIQYVDDSNNIITSDDSVGLENYINKYFKLIESYYNLNKLKINPDKSKIMITCKPNLRESVSKVKLTTNDYIIEQVTKVKALGIFITTGLTNHAMANHIISKVNYRLSILKGVFKFCYK